MQFRETLLNLAITAVLVLIVVLAGMLLKQSRRVPAALPVQVAKPVGSESEPARKTASDRFEILRHPEFVESRANEADTLRVRVGGHEHIFVLYFVDALEASTNHPQRVAEQGRYFGNATDKTITDTGLEAAAFVSDLLRTKPFHVLTRWEQVPNTTRYYALITVELEPGKPVYLADLLMQRGLARLAGVTTELPADARDLQTYISELQSLARQARTQKAGVWAKVTDG
jgi:endonuclease YncB( thermonuclease family)